MRNPVEPFVIWLDDEPNLLDAEIYDLLDQGFNAEPFMFVGEALEWFKDNEMLVEKASAILVDAMMPPRLDKRFFSPTGIPAGALFCNHIKELECWPRIRERIVLYTRLPRGPSLDQVRAFAIESELQLIQKSGASRIAVSLLTSGKIRKA